MGRYRISAQRYDEQNVRFDRVLEHYDEGTGLGIGTEAARAPRFGGSRKTR